MEYFGLLQFLISNFVKLLAKAYLVITQTTYPPTYNLSIKQPIQDPYQQMIHFWNRQEKTFLPQQIGLISGVILTLNP